MDRPEVPQPSTGTPEAMSALADTDIHEVGAGVPVLQRMTNRFVQLMELMHSKGGVSVADLRANAAAALHAALARLPAS